MVDAEVQGVVATLVCLALFIALVATMLRGK